MIFALVEREHVRNATYLVTTTAYQNNYRSMINYFFEKFAKKQQYRMFGVTSTGASAFGMGSNLS